MTKKTTKPSEKAGSVQYLNVDLTDSMRKALVSWIETADIIARIEDVVLAGLKFGISQDSYNECMQASITKLGTIGQNPTLVLVGRGGNIEQAIQAVLFKYFVVLQTHLEDGDVKNNRTVTDWG